MKLTSGLFLLFSFATLSAEVHAFTFPWSDAAKYKNECTKACVEESFGKAKALEINQRCGSKCDHLPLSPKDQWDKYDYCEKLAKDHRDFYQKFGNQLSTCDTERDQKMTECKKKNGLNTTNTPKEYVPGQIYKAHLLEQGLENCKQEVNASESAICRQLYIDRISIGSLPTCSKPEVKRP